MSDSPLLPNLDEFPPSPSPLARMADRIGSAAAWLFLLAVAISAYEVAMRYLFARPSSWAHVSVTTLCAVAFAIGGAYAMARDQHIRISVLVDGLNRGWQRACRLLGLIVGAFYLSGLAYGFWILASESILRFGASGQWQPELTPGPPNWPLPSFGKGMLLVMTLVFLALVMERLATMARGRD